MLLGQIARRLLHFAQRNPGSNGAPQTRCLTQVIAGHFEFIRSAMDARLIDPQVRLPPQILHAGELCCEQTTSAFDMRVSGSAISSPQGLVGLVFRCGGLAEIDASSSR